MCGVWSVLLVGETVHHDGPAGRPVRAGADRLVWRKTRWRYRGTGVSWSSGHAAFAVHVDTELAAPLPSGRVLGIDQTRRGKPVWTRDEASGRWRLIHDRWHTGIVDAAGTAGLLGHVDGRTSGLVAHWLADQPTAWRQNVTHLCINLSTSYAKAVADALPNAVQVRRPVAPGPDTRLVRADGEQADPPGRPRRPNPARQGRQREPATTTGPRTHTRHRGPEPVGDLPPAVALPIPHGRDRQSQGPTPRRTVEAWWPTIEAGLFTSYSDAPSDLS